MLSLSEQMIHSTVRIECSNSAGQISTGTGFFFNFPADGKIVPAIVTNRHVIQGAVQGRFCITLANEQNEPTYGMQASIEVQNFDKAWIHHPDSSVDLAIFLAAPIFNNLINHRKKPFFVGLDESLIPNKEFIENLTAMEEIVVIGYPNGIWDSRNNIPIIRRGITATPYFIDYKNKKEFLIDCAIFPGSSGSPIFLLNQGAYPNKSGRLTVDVRFKLLGIVYKTYLHTSDGQIKFVDIPTGLTPIPSVQIPNNLGICIKSDRILEFKKGLIKNGVRSSSYNNLIIKISIISNLSK